MSKKPKAGDKPEQGAGPTLYYSHDPMCSWCWGYTPTWEDLRSRVQRQYGDRISMVTLLGGLARDSDQPMPAAMQSHLKKTWKKIQKQIPGTRFNFDFWDQCTPRRSTWPACRAIIAARKQGEQYDRAMRRAIQHGYYLDARNPSRFETLASMAEEIGLNQERFSDDLSSQEVHDIHNREMRLTRRLGVQGFPSLVLVRDKTAYSVLLDYTGATRTLEHIGRLMDETRG